MVAQREKLRPTCRAFPFFPLPFRPFLPSLRAPEKKAAWAFSPPFFFSCVSFFFFPFSFISAGWKSMGPCDQLGVSFLFFSSPLLSSVHRAILVKRITNFSPKVTLPLHPSIISAVNGGPKMSIFDWNSSPLPSFSRFFPFL